MARREVIRFGALVTSPTHAMSYSRWAILLIFCAAAVLVLAMRWEASREDVRSARVARSEGREGLELHGGIDTNRMERHETLRVWLLFHNRSKSAITSLHFADWQMPGFTETGPCWLAHAPACVGSVRTGLPATLNAGESAVVTAEMQPASGSGRFPSPRWKKP